MPATRRTAIAIRHLAFENLGLLARLLHRADWEFSYRDAAVDDLDDPAIKSADLLVVLGGPIGVYDDDVYPFLRREISILEKRLAEDRPTLGICLGSQLMARALGSKVFAGPIKEIGWSPIALTERGRTSCLDVLAGGASVLHWHGDTFDLPREAVLLASTPRYENQAFSFGRNSLALQFHLEVDPRQLEEWYVGHAVELGAARVSIPDLRAASARVAPTLIPVAEKVFDRWLGDITA